MTDLRFLTPNNLIVGDFVMTQFNPNRPPEIAEVIAVDPAKDTVTLRYKDKGGEIRIDTATKWQNVVPYGIEIELLKKYGFQQASDKMAYGTTPDAWTLQMNGDSHVYNLIHSDSVWRLEVTWQDAGVHRHMTYEKLLYIHQLHHALQDHSLHSGLESPDRNLYL